MSFESVTGLPLRLPRGPGGRVLVVLGRVAVGVALTVGVRAGLRSLAEHRPLPRAQLAARANSICATAEKNFISFAKLVLTTYPPNVGQSLIDMTDQEARDLGALNPAAAVAPDWRAFLAGIRAHARESDALQRGDAAVRFPDPTGSAAARRLGISCELLNR